MQAVRCFGCLDARTWWLLANTASSGEQGLMLVFDGYAGQRRSAGMPQLTRVTQTGPPSMSSAPVSGSHAASAGGRAARIAACNARLSRASRGSSKAAPAGQTPGAPAALSTHARPPARQADGSACAAQPTARQRPSSACAAAHCRSGQGRQARATPLRSLWHPLPGAQRVLVGRRTVVPRGAARQAEASSFRARGSPQELHATRSPGREAAVCQDMHRMKKALCSGSVQGCAQRRTRLPPPRAGWPGAHDQIAAAARCGVRASGAGCSRPHATAPGSWPSSSTGLQASSLDRWGAQIGPERASTVERRHPLQQPQRAGGQLRSALKPCAGWSGT